MKFVSCIPIRGTSESNEEQEQVLCQCAINAIPESEQNLSQITVDELTASEGSELYGLKTLQISDLKVFESNREHVWYELIKFLSGHKIQIMPLNNKIKFSYWSCYTFDDKPWKLVMELQSSGIVKKLAEIQLEVVNDGEADLFQFTNVLFQHWCRSNDEIHKLSDQQQKNLDKIEELETYHQEFKALLQKRDKKTRSVIVELLNQKKAKIRELYKEIDILRASPDFKSQCQRPSDDVIMNSHVNNPVSHLISPGKRRKKIVVETAKQEVKRRLFPKDELGRDDFEEFQFFGISKPVGSLSRNTSPKKVVKQETQESETDNEEQDTSHHTLGNSVHFSGNPQGTTGFEVNMPFKDEKMDTENLIADTENLIANTDSNESEIEGETDTELHENNQLGNTDEADVATDAETDVEA